MKTKSTFIKTIIISTMCMFFALNSTAQNVNGEILYDTNNLVVLKVWGTHAERGYAHGYLLGEKIREVVIGYLIPRMYDFYPTARILVSDGKNLVLDSIYHVEAKSMIEGMVDAGCDTSDMDYIDLLVGACFSDLFGYMSMQSSPDECSTFINWGDATAGTDLDKKSVIARFSDWASLQPDIINNAVIIIHMPSEEGLQPWLIVGYAGEMVPSSGGLNQGGISVYKNGLGDYHEDAIMDSEYEPYQITMRKALEIDDYNDDGLHNAIDVRSALNSNPQGYATAHAISIVARYDSISNTRTAMIAVVAPTAPTHVYRTTSYNDTIPGDNLYAANSQIKRNDYRHYCYRYLNMVDHMGDGTGIGSAENWNLMKDYSGGSYNYAFMQHIPELDILKISVLRDSTNAWELDATTFDLREFFNRPPKFVSIPITMIGLNDEYSYEISVSDPDPYDSIRIFTEQLPYWLSLVDNGDGTALLSGTPDTMGVYAIVLKIDDGREEDTQEFDINVGITSKAETFATSLKLYPNPFKDKLYIEFEQEAELYIFGLSGKQLKHYHLKNPKNLIDLGELPLGVYFLRLQVGSEVITKKVVKL